MEEEERSLTQTPTWAVATVIIVMVVFVFLFTNSVELFGKWLDKRKRKPLLAALHKIKEELMVFGVMSLLMGHWSIFVANICIKSSVFGSRYYPCIPETESTKMLAQVVQHIIDSNSSENALTEDQSGGNDHAVRSYCAEGYESLASYESLEQLHRLLFVLAVTHITYSSVAIALAIIKIYSWRAWENEAKSVAAQSHQFINLLGFDKPFELDNSRASVKLTRLSTFTHHHASHPWSRHRILAWLLCLSRQFWSSINKFDYVALRFGYVTAHQLPLSYDFLNYIIRSMHEEFRNIVGISVPLWIYAIICIFLDFHGSKAYFWLSFLPAIIIILIGTKLHRIVVKLAVEIMESSSYMENHVFNLRDELFWFRKPKLLLRLIQFISFQNAFEMAMFLWSLWEIEGTSCFMKNPSFMVIRLAFGIISQVWCSFITFPLYVIITQMGSRFKRTVISEGVRISLHGWQNRVKARQNRNVHARLSSSSSMPLIQDFEDSNSSSTSRIVRRSSRKERTRRMSLGYGDAGVLFSSRNVSYVDEECSEQSYDSYSSSDQYDEDDVYYGRDDERHFHLT